MNLENILVHPRREIYRVQSETVIENLRRRNMEGTYCETSPDAVRHITGMIQEHAVVGMGGSMSLIQSGLLDALRLMDIVLLDRYRDDRTPEEIEEHKKLGAFADVMIASCNAITSDGKLVNEDGNGTRVAPMLFGPAKVILIAGINKIVPTLDMALARIKNVAAPMNCIRLKRNAPCARTGFCDDVNCFQPDRACSDIVIIESNSYPGRIHVVLVGEELGF
jgi:hypothetical protein